MIFLKNLASIRVYIVFPKFSCDQQRRVNECRFFTNLIGVLFVPIMIGIWSTNLLLSVVYLIINFIFVLNSYFL